MAQGQVRVAVVGAGDIGRGWAAMCVAAGWEVAIFDIDATVMETASDDIVSRAKKLIELERATDEHVDDGIAGLKVGRSILQACADAEWVIEAGPEDLRTKQRIFEAIEGAAKHARVITSSTSSLRIKDIVARCTTHHRAIVAHPMHPPELVPLVEIVPGPETDHTYVELLKGWLRALGKIPVEILKEVPGNVATRIAAAVWREAIDLVLTGVIGVDDLDRAVSVGPAIGWAAAGPHLSHHLAAGERDVHVHLQQLLHNHQEIWEDLPTWSKLEPEQLRKLLSMIEKAYDESVQQIRPARDRRLAGMLRGLERSRGSAT
jgi:3-hydroxypropionate dehydrogenase (NADP+)